jgi:putative transposase
MCLQILVSPSRAAETKGSNTRWGYDRIVGELKKLRIYSVSRATVSRVLQENGFDRGPKRGHGSWHEFIQRHIKTVWATDFFTKKVWTMRGPITYYVLFFIHLRTRRVHIAGMTPNPDGRWMAQIARNMSMVFAEEEAEFRPTRFIRDRDAKLAPELCSILETDGIQFRPIPPHSPNLNPFSEVWVGRTKAECLNHFIVFGDAHLRHILQEWLTHYHFQRPHQGLGNAPIDADPPPPAPMEQLSLDDVVCHESLGGLLRHYERRAA